MVFFGDHPRPGPQTALCLRHEQALDEYLSMRDRLGDSQPDARNVLPFAIFYEEAVVRWFDWMARRE